MSRANLKRYQNTYAEAMVIEIADVAAGLLYYVVYTPITHCASLLCCEDVRER